MHIWEQYYRRLLTENRIGFTMLAQTQVNLGSEQNVQPFSVETG